MTTPEMRNDASRRISRMQENMADKKRPKKVDPTVPATDTPPEPELYEEELEYMVLPEESASQISEANLKEGDVVIYLRAVTFKPEVLKNIAQRGPTALRDYAVKQPAYFLITRQEYAADVLKALLEDSINPPKKDEERE